MRTISLHSKPISTTKGNCQKCNKKNIKLYHAESADNIITSKSYCLSCAQTIAAQNFFEVISGKPTNPLNPHLSSLLQNIASNKKPKKNFSSEFDDFHQDLPF